MLEEQVRRTDHGGEAMDAPPSRSLLEAAQPTSWLARYRYAIFATDVGMILAALLIAHLLRFGDNFAYLSTGTVTVNYGYAALGIQLVWVMSLAATDSWSRRVVGVGIDEYRRVVVATFGGFGAVAILAYLLQLELSRLYFVVALPVGLVLLLGGRLGWRLMLKARRLRGSATIGALLVGDELDVEAICLELARAPQAGYRALAAVAPDLSYPDVQLVEPPYCGLPRVGFEDVPELAADERVGAVIVTASVPHEVLRRLAWQLENVDVALIVVPRLLDVAGPRVHIAPVGGLPMMQVDLPRFTGFAYGVKRAVDCAASVFAVLLAAPLFAAIAVAIKLDDGGPVFFRQERVGRDGKTFAMHKFRSMSVDAEGRSAELVAHDGAGPLFKLKHDPRVTRVGAVLRRYSLDELPQLWDVLCGSMSLVGPRPPLAREVASYEEHVHRRLLTKPGITGPWQVSGRSDLSWEESVRLDLGYVENWSLAGDLVLLLKTVRAVLRPSGAY